VEHVRQRSWRRTQTQTVAVILAIYWAVLCVGTHLPGGVIDGPPVSDKLLHVTAYAGLTFLLALLLPHLGLRRGRLYAGALLIVACYGAVDELGQIPVPGRTPDVKDWVANVLGAMTGLTLYWLAVRTMAAWNVGWLEVEKKPSPP